ncbi:MAG TPA: putative glycolipid-binding domain-containing protein [Verrucomicrobiae bacterium]|jgi:hypothetical protein|nr:putative glycolipid-binding domain-containing protein [Verrucomicrobiae bacterium]
MEASALWRTLYAPGHDSARVIAADNGWRLEGHAVFDRDGLACAVHYSVDVDENWRALSGRLRGHLGTSAIAHDIARDGDTWRLDGMPITAVNGLLDLDFGFTPATNFQQVRRMNLRDGERADIAVAWFDIGETKLTALAQHYERRDAAHYWYTSPTGYEATLVLAENGFVRQYPELWTMIR